MTGYFAYSMAGHDKGKIYLIIKEDADYVWLADGRARGLSNPKRKNKKHIQIIKKYGTLLKSCMVMNQTVAGNKSK